MRGLRYVKMKAFLLFEGANKIPVYSRWCKHKISYGCEVEGEAKGDRYNAGYDGWDHSNEIAGRPLAKYQRDTRRALHCL